jgi:hypothetical protein
VIKASSLSCRYIPDAPINIYENLPVGTKLIKLIATDRDIEGSVHYEFIAAQKEFSLNEGIMISESILHLLKYV